ncbi:hypothetical protein F4801DRAFT_599518 [Xylaria longipes]|nr:hypothetical protein F4801DRAFT_599518 [Xylaria longipes]
MDLPTGGHGGDVPTVSTERNGDHIKANNDYAFMRDCDASSRLTAQHYLWKDLFGYLVHPDISTRGGGLKVADVATGNGIWLQDLAEHTPSSTELHGFDISLDQVGPKPWLHHMHTWNIFEEPASQFLGNNDPRPVLENLKKLLKPGGYLQWDEVDTIGCSIKTVPGVTAENLDALFSQLKGRDTWKYNLTNILDENGYSGSALYTYKYGLRTARFWNDIYVSTWKEFAESVLKTPEVSHELELKGMQEVRNGAAIMVPKLVWIAQKV